MAAGVILINQSLADIPADKNSIFNFIGQGLGGSDEITEQGFTETINYYVGLLSKKEYVGFENASIAPDSEAAGDGGQDDDEALVIINGDSLLGSSGFSDSAERKSVLTYEIKSGDTPSSIADSFQISTNTLLWANNLDLYSATKIKPGDKLAILPISGIRHTIKKNETVQSVAKKYSASLDKILSFNNIKEGENLEIDSILIIPGGKMPAPPRPKRIRTTLASIEPGISGAKGAYRYTTSEEFNSPNAVAGDDHAPAHGRRFPWGQCTYYVALRRYVPWNGDAKNWIRNARAFGYQTGAEPRVGSIVATTENPRYGHVAYVEAVNGDMITISEMNFVGLGIKSVRVLSVASPVIRGYIYDKAE